MFTSFIINTFLPFLRETLYTGLVKPITEASKLFTHAVFQFLVLRTASSEGGKSGRQGG
jgi:hypothetical protein